MLALIIIGSVLLVIIALLLCSVSVTVDFQKELNVKIKYLFVTLYGIPPKIKKKPKKPKKNNPKKEARKKQKQEKHAKNHQITAQADTEKSDNGTDSSQGEAQSEKPKENENAENAESIENTAKTPKQKLDLETVRLMLDAANPPVRRLLKKIRVYDFYLDFVIGGEDAAKVAINYGKHCALVYGTIGWLKRTIRFEECETHIEADFDKTENDYFIHFKAKARLSTALGCLLAFFIAIMKSKAAAPAQKGSKQ